MGDVSRLTASDFKVPEGLAELNKTTDAKTEKKVPTEKEVKVSQAMLANTKMPVTEPTRNVLAEIAANLQPPNMGYTQGSPATNAPAPAGTPSPDAGAAKTGGNKIIIGGTRGEYTVKSLYEGLNKEAPSGEKVSYTDVMGVVDTANKEKLTTAEVRQLITDIKAEKAEKAKAESGKVEEKK